VSFDNWPITCNAAITTSIAFYGVFLIPSAQVIARVIAEVFLKLVGPLLLNSLHDDSVNSLARDLHRYSASGFTELLTGHKETFGGVSTVKQFTCKQKEPGIETSDLAKTRL
jgi:hypothetical protein